MNIKGRTAGCTVKWLCPSAAEVEWKEDAVPRRQRESALCNYIAGQQQLSNRMDGERGSNSSGKNSNKGVVVCQFIRFNWIEICRQDTLIPETAANNITKRNVCLHGLCWRLLRVLLLLSAALLIPLFFFSLSLASGAASSRRFASLGALNCNWIQRKETRSLSSTVGRGNGQHSLVDPSREEKDTLEIKLCDYQAAEDPEIILSSSVHLPSV